MANNGISTVRDPQLQEFMNSIGFDKRLLKYDIEGSKAHVMMLMGRNHITTKDGMDILNALNVVEEDANNGGLKLEQEFEDVHMNVEAALVAQVGEKGGMVHMARSRNDQVALDLRLYTTDEIANIIALIKDLQGILLDLAEANMGVVIPGYTHLQQAQPVLLSHYALAHFHQLQRDIQRFKQTLPRVRVNPLGSAALAGTGIDIDREQTTEILGLDSPSENSLDGVSDRDFALETLFNASVCMTHLSGLCEELILWSSQEFGLIRFGDGHVLGSSIMPQKHNPDIAELVRGKVGRVNGNLLALLTTLKGLPLAYNKDLQEDKEALFDSVDTLKGSLMALKTALETAEVVLDQEAVIEELENNFANATALADHITVEMGVPFRSAYKMTKDIIAECAGTNTTLNQFPLEEYQKFGDFTEDVYTALDIMKSMEKKGSYGGTTLPRVKEALTKARETLANENGC